MKTFVFYLVPGFSMLPLTAAIDILRSANRILGFEAYRWRFVSVDGLPVACSAGLDFEVTSSTSDLSAVDICEIDHLFVCAGMRVKSCCREETAAFIRTAYEKGVSIGALCTATYLLAHAGILSGKRCTIHWELLPSLSEDFPEVLAHTKIYEIDDRIHTCAGGTASIDMMIALVGSQFGSQIVRHLCDQQLTDNIRPARNGQRIPLRQLHHTDHPVALRVIEIMEDHISRPLSLEEIADEIDVSRRQIERVFQQQQGCSPAVFYKNMRLEKAHYLLRYSASAIVEIASICGFVSSSHFSKSYRMKFGRPPQDERRGKRKSVNYSPNYNREVRTELTLS